jgi:putative phage-type endonuclease
MNKSKEWYEKRRQGITGSDISAICGLNPYKTSIDVYLDKTSKKGHQDKSSEPMYWGNRLEAIIAEEYSLRKNVQISIEEEILQHEKYNFMLGSIDRWVNDKEYVLECKTIGSRLIDQLGEVGTDQIPSYWLTQVAWYVAITNTPKADIAVLAAGQDFRVYTYERDYDFENKLIELAYRFWQNHIEKDIPPAPVLVSDLDKLYPNSSEKSVYASNYIEKKVEQLNNLKTQKKSIETEMESCEFAIKEFMKDSDILLSEQDAKPLVTWKKNKDSMVLDTEKLKLEMPEAYNSFLKKRIGSRVFLVKQAKMPQN